MNSGLAYIVLALLVVVAVVQGVLLIATMRQVGGLLLRLAPAHPGDVEEGGPSEGDVVPTEYLSHVVVPAIVIFMSPECGLCKFLHPAIPAMVKQYPEIQFVAAIRGADPAKEAAYARDLGIGNVKLKPLFGVWGIPGTPYIVGLDARGRIRVKGVANNLEHLESAAQRVLAEDDVLLTEHDDVNGHSGFELAAARPRMDLKTKAMTHEFVDASSAGGEKEGAQDGE